ncbi:hypothetical protein [Propionimicrobium sp. PCR01-08-3]|uniref:baeRF3 domain-containing protein n=1 Tax=Propionimicrobium sp. PCR01-08-3 TaxID=3052086 RepID=UPI00255D123C|nr:hypothetical protein [Propionimicrobium sp. PCR01-08-3]WIY82512.1 hypothetical protein QQ658_13570 [Propionimicrobium sp. PCR01-08-3]
MSANSQGKVDQLDFSDVWEAGAGAGPKITFTVPTEVADTRASKSGTELKNLLKQARAELNVVGVLGDQADDLLEPVEELVRDTTYWRLQSRGLIIFVAPGFFRAVRVPVEVDAHVTVGERFHLTPIAAVLATGGRCYVLALAKNGVRLFNSTRNSIDQLDLGAIPATFDDVIDELPEPELQVRSAGPGAVGYHGHGDNGDTDRLLTEKFITAVAKGVDQELGTARSQPLVLASVAEYLPIFRKVSRYPAIQDAVIAGNPEHTQPDKLRSDAWAILAESSRERETAAREQALAQVHSGRGSLDLAEICRAATEGRVDTLYLPEDLSRLSDPETAAFVDAAIFDVLQNSGSLRLLSDGDEPAQPMATFRY